MSNSPAHKDKPSAFWLAVLVAVGLLAYGLLEGSAQWLARRSGINRHLEEFRAKAASEGLAAQDYATKLGLDAYLGWGKSSVRIHEPSGHLGQVKTILFIGDSVTAGLDVRVGEEDYPSRIAAMLGDKGVRIVNLAVRGYGVDQMWLKLLMEADRYHPDAVVFAYIPHDLLRPANDFNFGLTKPKFGFADGKTRLALAEDMAEFNQAYQSAVAGLRLGWWDLSHYWRNKEYYAPDLFSDYYYRLFLHIGGGLAELSQERGIPIYLVKLTNIENFKGYRKLVNLAAEGLTRPTRWQSAKVVYLDMDYCVKPKALAEDMDLDREFFHHPSALGHALIAECLGDYLDAIVLGGNR